MRIGDNNNVRVLSGDSKGKFKIQIEASEISSDFTLEGRNLHEVDPHSSIFLSFVANCRSSATNAVEATESVRSRR
jgi:hypothetical protein